MTSIMFDEIIFHDDTTRKSKRKTQECDSIENIDGSIMYVLDIDIGSKQKEEDDMASPRTYIEELSHALKISWPFLVIVIGSAFGFNYFTQGRIDSSRSSLESQISQVREEIAAARSGASSDNKDLRGDINQGFSKVSDRLEDINKTLTAIQVDLATQKAKSEKTN